MPRSRSVCIPRLSGAAAVRLFVSPWVAAMIHNRYLPMWLHRVCSGVLGAVVLAAIGSIWFAEPSGTWRHILSRCLLWASVPAGIVLACISHRFSIVEGVAGGEGYDELHEQNENKKTD